MPCLRQKNQTFLWLNSGLLPSTPGTTHFKTQFTGRGSMSPFTLGGSTAPLQLARQCTGRNTALSTPFPTHFSDRAVADALFSHSGCDSGDQTDFSHTVHLKNHDRAKQQMLPCLSSQRAVPFPREQVSSLPRTWPDLGTPAASEVLQSNAAVCWHQGEGHS